MTYTTETNHTQTVTGNRDFSVGFPFLATTDIKVQLNGVTKTLTNDYTIVQSGANTTINFNTAPADNATIRIFRDTDIDDIEATYVAGSAIRSSDLNTNNKQLLYAAQEFGTLKSDNSVSFTLGDKGDIAVNSSSDWTLQNNSVELANMADNSVGTSELVNDCVNQDKIANNAVLRANIIADAIDGTKIADDSINSEHYVDGSIDTAHIADSQITLAKLASAVLTSIQTTYSNPVGTVIWYAADAIPTGYLECAGATVSRSTYSALFAVIGTVYGAGDGSSTFKLPDLRGEFVRGYDHGRGIDAGRGIGTAQSDEFKEHQHEFGCDDQVRSQGGYTALGSFAYDANSSTSGGGQRARTKNDNTNSGGTETRPRNIALLACIKY